MRFPGKLDQIAFISHNEADTAGVKRQLNLTDSDWIEDVVTARGLVRGVNATNRARLLFNYDMGIEVEILQYLEGDNYASSLPGQRVCHIGIHADNGLFGGKRFVPAFTAPIVQRVETIEHTNPFLLENGRRYRYTIYDTIYQIGVYTKVIERINRGDRG